MADTISGKTTVKLFLEHKGYGFLDSPEGEGEDIFVHYSHIAGNGFKTLTAGQFVEFEATRTAKGWQTTIVTAIS